MNRDEQELRNLTVMIEQTKNEKLRKQLIRERNQLLQKLGGFK